MTEIIEPEEEIIKIIICDASEDGISYTKELLRRCPCVQIVAIAKTKIKLLQLLEKNIAADVILLDIHLPCTNSLRLIRDIAQNHKQYKLLVFSDIEDIETITSLISSGTNGFLYKKEVIPAFIEEALSLIVKKGCYTNLFISENMYHKAKQQKAKLPKTGIFSITQQEEAVLRLLQTDNANKEIAESLGLKKKTIDVHCNSIYKKLGITTRAGAVEVGMFNFSFGWG